MRIRFLGVAALTLLAFVSGCASSPLAGDGAQQQPLRPITPGWTMVAHVATLDFSHRVRGHGDTRKASLRKAPDNFEIAYLIPRSDGTWSASVDGDASQPGVEAIAVDLHNRRVGLAAVGTAMASNGAEASVCEMNRDGDRQRAGYLLCNSTLTKEVIDLGVIFKPLELAGYKIQARELDQPKFQNALSHVDLDQLYNLLLAERADRARQRDMEKQRAEMQIAMFRRSLAPGMQTYCGMVVEVRDAIVLVQLGSDARWVARDRILPLGPNNRPTPGAC